MNFEKKMIEEKITRVPPLSIPRVHGVEYLLSQSNSPWSRNWLGKVMYKENKEKKRMKCGIKV